MERRDVSGRARRLPGQTDAGAGEGEAGAADADERAAAKVWTGIAEGEDVYATRLVAERGYAGGLKWVAGVDPATVGDRGLNRAVQRWRQRCESAVSARSVGGDSLGFLMPGDELWPRRLNDLGESRPLGLWYQGDPRVLARMGLGIVGSRDASAYGRRIATDLAFELASAGLSIVSGGALGIDAAAHRGALAADGYTVAVAAGGADRFYPASHADLYLDILRRGGALCSESPPGAAPHRHRFLSRNRIIAALAEAIVVVEAPHRSGALSTAHHAMAVGRQVGAVPGPVTSARSVGCHRLLRESAVCVTSTAEVAELLGWQGWSPGASASGTPTSTSDAASPSARRGGQARCQGAVDTRGQQLALDLDPLAARVRDALPVVRAVAVEGIAAAAGLSVPESLTGLGRLERMGVARNERGMWRLA